VSLAQSRELVSVVAATYGLQPVSDPHALEDSVNLNFVLWHGGRRLVVRVYRPSMTVPRLEAVQRIREFLIDGDLPFAPLRRTLDGKRWCEFDGRLVEVEEFVPSETFMESFAHIHLAMPMFAKIHNRLRVAPPDEAAATPLVANHVGADRVVDAVAAAVAALPSGDFSAAESRYVTIAETLSCQLGQAEAAYEDQLLRQLVHGDYWDDNVKFTGSRISLIIDLDFMGWRPRIDDLALTLFYANERLRRRDTSDQRRGRLRELVDAYDGALRPHLSLAERQALPYAIARTPLCFVADWVRDPGLAGEVLANRGPAWARALSMINDTSWTTAFV
jgi:Ser/Thr protein kinase RdoA (MazF antagonist)